MKSDTRVRLLCIYKVLWEHTDAAHPITTAEMIALLKENHGLIVNRDTVVRDITVLQECGYPVEKVRSHQNNRYYYDGQSFSTAELKTLLDVVASSRFITEKKSVALSDKLVKLASEYERPQLERSLRLTGRVKSDNEKGYYIVDAINRAINEGRKIRFKYFDYNSRRRKVLRHDGKPYTLSPYGLVCDGDFYYVVGHCNSHDTVQHFRLDRISGEPDILDETIDRKPKGFNIHKYTKSMFRMFGSGETTKVTLLCKTYTMKAVVDYFGKDFKVEALDEDSFRATIDICPSLTFYRWVFGWDGGMKIEGPEDVREEYIEMLERAMRS